MLLPAVTDARYTICIQF